MVFQYIEPMRAVHVKAKKGVDGVISIINTPKHGKRVVFGKKIQNILDLQAEVFMCKVGDELAVAGKAVREQFSKYSLCESGGRKVIYCASLVDELTEFFSLDFTNHACATLTCYRREVDDDDPQDNPIVIISSNKKETERNNKEENDNEK